MKAEIRPVGELKKADMPKGLRISHRKDQLAYGYKVINSKGKTLIDCRLYAPGSAYYCCLWLNNGSCHFSGSGSAGGYGYHKGSASLSDAIRNLIETDMDATPLNYIKFEGSVSGVGESAMREALETLANLIDNDETKFVIDFQA